MLSAKRDAASAERFFRKALNASHNQEPNGQSPVAYGGKPLRVRGLPTEGNPPSAPLSPPSALDSPRVINVDKNAAYPPAIDSLTKDKTLPENAELRPVKYLNNIVEQDHRAIKRLAKPPLANRRATAVRLAVNPGMGFGSFNTARRTLRGYEAMNMIRKGQIQGAEKGDIQAQVEFVDQIFGVAA